MDEIEIIIYLGSDWPTYHRRPMIEALARNTEGFARILCINQPVVPMTDWKFNRSRLHRHQACPEPERLSRNLYLFTPRLRWHDRLLSLVGKKDVNLFSLANQIRTVRERIGAAPDFTVSWLYRPDQHAMVGLASEDFLVYECLDEFQRRVSDGKFMPKAADQEQVILRRADLVLASSLLLHESRSGQHDNVHYFSNGVDFDLFAQPRDYEPQELADIRRPIIGYTGNLTVFLDEALLHRIARSFPDWSLVLVGPHDEDLDLDGLRGMPNVHFVGRRPHWELPAFSQAFDVAILPLRKNPYLEKCNPLSLYEHMAAGTPIVITDIPEARRVADAAYVAWSDDDFLSSIRKAVEDYDCERIIRGQTIASERSWDNITQAMTQTLIHAIEEKINGEDDCGQQWDWEPREMEIITR